MPTPLLLLISACLAQAPQQPPPPPPSPARPASELRAIDALLASARALQRDDHAFSGTFSVAAGRDAGVPDTPPVEYRGAVSGAVHLLRLGEHTVLTHGQRQIERRGDAPFTVPQGEAPDCPLSPRALAAYATTATIGAVTAGSWHDRPAMRALLTWRGDAAAALVGEACCPAAKWRSLLDGMPNRLRKGEPERNDVSATVVFDPAMRTILAATVRFAVVGPDEPRDVDPEPPCPEGLPPLTKALWYQFVYTTEVLPKPAEPMPRLDEKDRERLGLPTAPAPQPDTKPRR